MRVAAALAAFLLLAACLDPAGRVEGDGAGAASGAGGAGGSGEGGGGAGGGIGGAPYTRVPVDGTFAPWRSCLEPAPSTAVCRDGTCLTELRTGLDHAHDLATDGDGHLWLVGEAGVDFRVSFHDGAGWSLLPDLEEAALETPGRPCIAARGPDDVWVGGAALHRWDGEAWSRVELPPGVAAAVAIVLLPDGAMAMLASGGAVLAFDGASWSELGAPLRSARSLAAASLDELWIGGNGEAARWDGAGWTTRALPSGWTTVATDGARAFACGSRGTFSELRADGTESWAVEGFACDSLALADGLVFLAGLGPGASPALLRWDGERLEEAPPPPTAYADRGHRVRWDGASLWYASSGGGLHVRDACWLEHQAPRAARANALAGPDEARLVAVGDFGWNARWIDGRWRVLRRAADEDLVGAASTVDGGIWAVGAARAVLRQAGDGWSSHAPPDLPRAAREVRADGPDVWLAGGPREALRWDGTAWIDHALPEGARGWGLGFGPATTWLVTATDGEAGVAIRRRASDEWAVRARTLARLRGVEPIDDERAWLSGEDHLALLDAEGAIELVDTGAPAAAWAGLAIDGDDVWLRGASGVARLHASGFHAAPAEPGDPAIAAVDGERWYTAWHGRLLHETASGVREHVLEKDSFRAVVRAIHAVAADDVWIAGEDGVIARWDGAALRRHDRPGGFEPWSAVFAHAGAAWVGALDGALACVRPDGSCGHAALDRAILGLGGTAPDDVWAVGERGLIARFDGVRWRSLPSPTEADLRSVWAAGRDDAFGASAAGEVLRWDGEAWRVIHEAGVPLDEVRGRAGDDVWAIGADWSRGVLLHFDGASWTDRHGGPWAHDGLGRLFRLADGTLLVAAGDRLLRRAQDGAWVAEPAPFGAVDVAWSSPEGAIWLHTHSGLARREPEAPATSPRGAPRGSRSP